MKTVFTIVHICLISLWMHLPLLMKSQDTRITLSEQYGIFYVPNYGEWLPSIMSNNDFFVFEHKNSGAIVKIKKEQVNIQSSQEFNQQVLQYINGLGRNQEFVELRKQFVPIRVLSQKGTHFLKVKSRQSGTSKFVLNPEVDKKLFHIEILENKSGNEPSQDVMKFISLLSLQPISAADIAAANTKDKLIPQDEIKTQNEKDDLSSFKKVKAVPADKKTETLPVDKQKEIEVTVKGTKEKEKEQVNKDNKDTVLPDQKDKTDLPKNKTEVPTSDDTVSKTPNTAFDPEIANKAERIPDGDEMEPVVNPVGTIKRIPNDASWAAGLAKNPKELLDALDGGRPGGNVNAMMTLLRQAQGPFDEAEEKDLIIQFDPYAKSGSEKAGKAIRTQSELLLQAMIHRQLMVQSAWEYDFALAQHELAKMMQDEDEADISLMIMELQNLLMQDQQKRIENIVRQSEAEPQIPTPEELAREDEESRQNALKALNLEEENKNETQSLRIIGKWVKTGYHSTPGWKPRDNDEDFTAGKDNINWKYKIKDKEYNKTTKKYDIITLASINMQINMKCPEFITLYERKDNSGQFKAQLEKVQFLAEIKDAGSDISTKIENYTEEVSIYLGIMPPRIYMDDENSDNIDYWINIGPERLSIFPLNWRILAYNVKGKFIDSWNNPHIVYVAKPEKVEQNKTSSTFDLIFGEGNKTLHFVVATRNGWLSTDYKWEPSETKQNDSGQSQMTGDQIKDEAIAEHLANISAAEKALKSINEELSRETDSDRIESLRLQALHMKQNIHESKDLIESIKTGTIVKTRGPWDEHAAVVMAESSRKLREEFQRASQMQASYVRLLNILKKYNPEEAEKFRQNMSNDVIKGIFDAGGFEKAQTAIDALHAATKGAATIEQLKLETQKDKAFDFLKMVERHLGYVETVKSGCDKAVFWGSLATGMWPGLLLYMSYEGGCTGIEKGPKEAIKNMAIQGGIMLGMAGVMKVGSWGIGKLLNPKVIQSETNAIKNFSDLKYYLQERDMNQALIKNLKDRVKDFNKIKTTTNMTGPEVHAIRQALDDAVAACNSSPLAKRMMKNELTTLQNQIKSGATRNYSSLRECLSYQNVFDNRLRKNIYPKVDADFISKMNKQGYNVDKKWFQEFRNATSKGIDADRDLGLIAEFEKLVRKDGQRVSYGQFMKDGQKAYNESYKTVTGRSAALADQNITTSAHGESFPLSWLKKKMEGPFTTLDPPVTPQDFQKAGKAIYTKVENALKGHDPAFVKMQKACASLSKDLKTKVLDRLKNPPANTGLSPEAQQQALNHWQKVQKVMDDFATGNSDPFTTMKKLQQLTGSTSISESAGSVQKLLNKLGGVTN
ncbi:MAG TPA: hypothetical protein PK047_13080 [Saprospiraceae bacterium]|nr:hypothetical protein [Saprospiraceae bacterium]HRO09793.1 hypothetical protein [Saprospiraceae bacterium]HRP43047.1 hypothetical protein [Saprospiraceae bacterium]